MRKIAINGFGRIGRLIFKELVKDSDYKIVAINDLADAKTLAHLLKFDTAHGKFDGTIEVNGNNIVVNGQDIKVLNEKDPSELPWEELEVELVVEATGKFTTKEDVKQHIEAGAKKVMLTAPSKDIEKAIVYSVNEQTLTPDDEIIGAASCTTNALAPVVNVLHNKFGIEKGFMNTVHAYTANQPIQDAPNKDLRRARAGAVNIVPTSTGATKALGLVIPELKGRIDGIAMRVPVLTGSVIDLVLEFTDQNVTIEDINSAIKEMSNSSLAYIDEPIVSSDVIGATYGAGFDSLLTQEVNVDGKKLFKVIIWYDNEVSYVSQYVRTFKHFANL